MTQPVQTPVIQSCGNCIYFRNGECHRYSPKSLTGLMAKAEDPLDPTLILFIKWPKVDAADWCGEWVTK